MKSSKSIALPFDYLAARRALYARSLAEFCKRAWQEIETVPLLWNWHHDAICEHLEAQTRGEIRNLLINVPPRSLKSTIVSVCWPAWMWTLDAGEKFICASYGESLALDLSITMRRLVASEWYQSLWGERFEIRDDQDAKGKYDTSKGGYRISVGSGGKVLGRGGNRLILDDPHKTDEVESEVIREGIVSWIGSGWERRQNDPIHGTSTIVMQRLHERDVSGVLLERGDYDALVVPMEYAERRTRTSIQWADPRSSSGELLQPSRWGPAEIASIKLGLGSYGYAGQMQQEPSPSGGGMFQREWWRYFREVNGAPIPGRPDVAMRPVHWDRKIISVDSTFGTTPKNAKDDKPDAVAIVTIATKGTDKYVLKAVARPMDILEAMAEIRKMKQEHPDAYAVVIENKANGKAIMQQLRNSIPGIVEFNPMGDKSARAMSVSPQLEAGNVWLPYNARWTEDFVEEFAKFPKGKHDDQVDATSQAVIWLDDPKHGGALWAMAALGG